MKPAKETEKKLLALCGVLPVLADFIEDLNMEHVFTKNIKRKANLLLEEIRKTDEGILKHTNKRPIANQYCEGKVKRTSNRGVK